MTVSTFPYPAGLKEQLEISLSTALGISRYQDHCLHVLVSPRDTRGRKAPSAAKAAYYELGIFYNGTDTRADDPFRLDAIEKAVRDVPGVYRTTRVSPGNHGSRLGLRTWTGRYTEAAPTWPSSAP